MSTTATKIDPLQVFMQAMGLGTKPSSLNTLSAQSANQFNAFFTGLPKPMQTAIYNRMATTPAQQLQQTSDELAVKEGHQARLNEIARDNEAKKLPISREAAQIRTGEIGDRIGLSTDASLRVIDRLQGGVNRQSDYDQAAVMRGYELDDKRIELVRQQLEADRSRANLDRMFGGIIGLASFLV